ncbi:hypothetical protein GDO86_017750 [Hymenochirus boettgeri]|uniref:G-protein coupled receptors family 1 profile domain-containing protein n=1 Tax=Hymenochirus boettgeri TaxID=247094 RepID=A0A8T2ISZ5_9PIPI|nr:hypothetical protein GDO86_017750 [Hymenochirus boettgeri]
MILFLYLMILAENVLITIQIYIDSRLHTPMFFFLATLACLDMCYSSVTTPQILFDLPKQRRVISLQDCITQIYFFIGFASSEVALLAVMSYDRYIAICRPLHYMQIMCWKTCVLLITGAFLGEDKVSFNIYSVLTPLLNPLIYSLRNQELKVSLKKYLIKLSIPIKKY